MHTFTPSLSDTTKCGTCKRSFVDHTELATCECCTNVGKMELFVDILMCPDCYAKEKQAQIDANNPEIQAKRVEEARERERMNAMLSNGVSTATSGILSIDNLVDKARALDYQVQVRPDIFNAATIALNEVFAAIDADATIPASEKQFKKAEFTEERKKHFQKVIFDANSAVIEANNHLRVLQSEQNKIVNTLRAEEREKLKLQHPEYKPGTVKAPKEGAAKPRPPKKPKFDKKELMDEVAALVAAGLPATLSGIQSICTSRDMTPKQAAGYFRKMIEGN